MLERAGYWRTRVRTQTVKPLTITLFSQRRPSQRGVKTRKKKLTGQWGVEIPGETRIPAFGYLSH